MLGVVYWSTLAVQQSRVDAEIARETERLYGQLRDRTISEMAAVVTRTTVGPRGRTTIYMLATQRREYIAGNLRDWPGFREDTPGGAPGMQEFPLGRTDEGRDAVARGRAVTLPTGERLLVARNVTELNDLRDLVTRWLLAALGVTVAVGLGGGWFLSRRLSSRLDAVARNSQAILEGDLERRMPVSPRGDEFDALAESLNRMLDRIESLMKGMREVSDSIAHDMRSPLSRLRSRIEVALMQPPDAPAYREVLRQTVEDMDGVLAMFNSLLTIALAESGASRERFAPVDLRAIAEDTVETYEPAAEERGLRLTLDAPVPVTLRGDPQLLAQALANLLDNAIKYVPAPGSVTVRVRGGEHVTFEVADDGPGIPASFRDKAFERFTRVEQSRTTPGSGLGLSLVRAVARLHGGEVTLADAGPGLVVGVHLPRA
ncbi:MAG: HAMP domain-containing sensor histidine kinase [Thermodesulfobacteriota bacterium]